ncbi:hypothetical protein P3825_19595 [Pseudomonas aeruginosa]|nr:hypothetical protein [Pseudomonas aeruginosa]
MNKANECTCPSGDGSLVHPCPAHPAVEQVGGDERAAFELFVRKHCGMPAHIAVNWDAKFTNDAWEGWKARAALAQPSGEVVVTKNESGAIVSVTRQDKEGRVLSVIAESATLTAQAEQAEAERPEVVAWQYRVTAGPQTGWSLWHPGKGEEFERSYTVERRPLMTVAQHERIVGELRAVIAQLRQHKNDYMDSGQETYRALQSEIREREAEIARLDGLVSVRTAERDAALARVAELERGKVYVEARQCDECQHGGINDSATGVAACHECDWTGPEPEEDRCPGCQRENCMAAACPQCGARYVLVASEEIAAPVAQAQHSVPVAREQLERLVRILDAHNYAKDAEALMALLAAAPAQAQHCVPELLVRAEDFVSGKEVPQAWLDVQAERRRQITAEGWTPEHDDLYCAAELPRAAAAYILNGANDEAPAIWPFSAKWWKPSTARRDMVKACALALAEIERLDRAASGKEVGHE